MVEGVGVDSTDRLRKLQALTDAALAHLELDALLCAAGSHPRGPRGRHVRGPVARRGDERAGRAGGGRDRGGGRARVRIPVGARLRGPRRGGARPVILDDVDHADVLNPILRQKGIKSMLGVPLLVGGEVIGVLHVGTLVPRKFDDDDVELLQFAGDRAAIAIDHARAFEAERRARQRLEHVQAVTDAALAHLELDELLAVLLPRIRDILGRTRARCSCSTRRRTSWWRGRRSGSRRRSSRGSGSPSAAASPAGSRRPEQPVILDDVDHADVLNPILREKGIKSMLGVPLLVDGDAIGVLHVGTLVHRRFTADDVELLELVADRVALAIERAPAPRADGAAR